MKMISAESILAKEPLIQEQHVSLTNGITLGFNTIRTKEMKKTTTAGIYIWSILSILYFVFIVSFELYNFWAL